MSTICGHQGAGSTYLSLYTDVELNHLKEYHVKHPNIPQILCQNLELKSDLVENFIQSTLRNPEKMQKRENSIIGPALFPFMEEFKKHLSIPSLHIVSG